uniref:Cystatin domain-containing protein n=1 Tax=Steinernema glaseri TaxID=37863 RepID=A0A1I8AFJ9_9BILA
MKLLCAVLFIHAVLLFGAVSPKMTGGWKDLSPESDDVQELSWTAVKKINAESNDLFHLVPVKVLKAKSQIVAGTNYQLELEVAQSNCAKNQVTHDQLKAQPCQLKDAPRRHLYVVKIWVKPWEDFEQVTIESSKQL